MKKEIALFHLCNGAQLGGSSSYVVHLYAGLLRAGYSPTLYKIGASYKKEPMDFMYGIKYIRVNIEVALHLAKKNPALITYCFWKENGEKAKQLMSIGVPIVVHDPAEFTEDYLQFCRTHPYDRTLVIRPKNKRNLEAYGVYSTFAPHPYLPVTPEPAAGPAQGVAVSCVRVDFRKHQEIICQANAQYDAGIDMYGEPNRLFVYHTLNKKYPGWDARYKGTYPSEFGAAVKILSRYEWAIDLTNIKTDGGGTQYAFFEAWNSNRPLIVNSAWIGDGRESDLKHGVNCFAVTDAEDLFNVLRNTSNEERIFAVENGKKLMDRHNAVKVASSIYAICYHYFHNQKTIYER